MQTLQRIIVGDCVEGLRTLPDASVHCCVTSPPYWNLRDYQRDGQIGVEKNPEAYVTRLVGVFREVRRVMRSDATCWLNIGDTYGDKKHLLGIPWRVAFALQADGWWLRQDIIWHKPNPMPESVRDRCTKAHEYVFLLTKSERYYYDADAVKEESARPDLIGKTRNMRKNGADSTLRNDAGREGIPYCDPTGRNRRSVWTITTKPYSGAHFAVMPPALVKPCIEAGTSERGCCSRCGAPYTRVVERHREPTRPGAVSKVYAVADDSASEVVGNRDPLRHCTKTKTTGWQAGCECGEREVVPCTVLDPFAGSGTTLAVAAELGRSGVGCELNPEYAKLAKQRITEVKDSIGLFDTGSVEVIEGTTRV